MKLSVVITAYNVEDYVVECVNSVKYQKLDKGHSVEIIVVEDKSTDSTLKKLHELDKLKVIENKENVGAGLSRRIGIQHSTGDYVMLLDGDDYLENKNHLNILLNKAEETNADVVGGGIKILKEDNSYDITSYGTYTCEGNDKLSKFWGERIVFMNNKIIRRTMYDKFPYCERRYIEDTPVIIPILWAANKVEYVDTIGYVYRMRGDSLTHKADDFKNLVFKGLCWCDLMEFFNVNDKSVFDYIPIKNYITGIINILNNSILTTNIVQPYANEFAELMFRLINLIKVESINFKEIKYNNNNGQK